MTRMHRLESLVIEWGAAGVALTGEAESGDLHVVVPFPEGALVGAIDGLGHGAEAAVAARAAARLLETNAGEPLSALVQRCHEGLRRTRGVAMTLASFNTSESSMTWIGVGNVEGVLLRANRTAHPAREAITLAGGLIGYHLPSLRVVALPVSPGDTLILATDGIRSGFMDDLVLERSPQEIAESILARCAKGSDDASVVVARYVGGTPLSVPIRHESDVVMVRMRARELGQHEGLPQSAIAALATALSEVARNIIVYARAGELLLGAVHERGRRGVVVVALDDGPGIPEPEQAMQDGYSTAQSLGLGLSSARRLVDEFELLSAVGRGTTVIMKKWIQ